MLNIWQGPQIESQAYREHAWDAHTIMRKYKLWIINSEFKRNDNIIIDAKDNKIKLNCWVVGEVLENDVHWWFACEEEKRRWW